MEFELSCWICRKSVDPTDGVIYVQMAELLEAEKAIQDWESSHGIVVSAAELMKMPHRARWRVAHDACRMDKEDGEAYEIDVSRFQTFAHALSWTAHLMEKTWLPYTSWDMFIGSISPEA